MIRILFVARYRDTTMSRKVGLLAKQSDMTVWHVVPSHWQDELLSLQQPTADLGAYRQVAVPMIGRPGDPHRAMYRTVLFGMHRFRPHIIHAEEEIDSLAAMQIAVARRLIAPRAKLLLHTWQNINRPKRWYVKAVFRAVLAASDGVLCANHEAESILQGEGYRRFTAVLPAVGVDTETFIPVPRERPAGDPFVVGYVGRVVLEKGLDTMIRALSRLNRDLDLGGPLGQPRRPLQLAIIGDGAYRHELAGEVSSLGLSDLVRCLSPMPPSEVAKQMAAFDALALPSRTTAVWKEQFGRVLVEAMACKVPVVGSDSGAIPEVIGDAGLIFPEGDADALASCLRRLIASPDLCRDLGDRGYDRVMKHYSQEHIARQTAEYYRRMMPCPLPR